MAKNTQRGANDPSQYLNKELLTHVAYDPNNPTICWAYPQYYLDDGTFYPVDEASFPDNGCLPIQWDENSNSSSRDIEREYGNALVLKIFIFDENEDYGKQNIDQMYVADARDVEFIKIAESGDFCSLIQSFENTSGCSYTSSEDKLFFPKNRRCPLTEEVLIPFKGDGIDIPYWYEGPFDWTVEGNDYRISPLPALNYFYYKFNVRNLEQRVELHDEKAGTSFRFVVRDEIFEGKAADEKIDGLSDEELILAMAVSIGGDLKTDVETAERTLEKVASSSTDKLFEGQRASRLQSLIKNSSVKSILEKNNKTDLKTKKTKLEKDIEGLEIEKEKAIELIGKAKELDDIDDKLIAKTDELGAIEKKVVSENKKLEKIKSKKTPEIEKEIRQSKIAEIVDDLSPEKLEKKIIEDKVLDTLIEEVNKNKQKEESIEKYSLPIVKSKDREPKDIIESIHSDIVAKGRNYSKDFITNLMICLTQGYIVTLAGMPGTGKTSLANKLVEVLGLDQNRFTEVAVERGWTSYKDFVGYHNPLTDTLVQANPEVCGALMALDKEFADNKDESKVAPYYILLDEANLSPIEHYWAPFLSACDKLGDKNKDIQLNLGGEKQLTLPKYLRFIATVNFDHTTEELSPRFLDRSWVISLDADCSTQRSKSDSSEVEIKAPFSVEDFEKVFGVDAYDKVVDWKNYISDDEYLKKKISKRSGNMIQNYVNTATFLGMDEVVAVDYAIFQKVLPALNGYSDELRDLLKAIKDGEGNYKNLSLTKDKAADMYERGKDRNYYQFFDVE